MEFYELNTLVKKAVPASNIFFCTFQRGQGIVLAFFYLINVVGLRGGVGRCEGDQGPAKQ